MVLVIGLGVFHLITINTKQRFFERFGDPMTNAKNISDQKFKVALFELREYEKVHFGLGKKLVEAYDGTDYGLDYLALGSINKSLSLHTAFCDLIEKGNVVAAAPLAKIQLDNALRFFAAYLVENPHEFALEVMRGTKVEDLKDMNGIEMHDPYLLDKLSLEIHFIKNLYNTTNGFVELSDQHVFQTISKIDKMKAGGFKTPNLIGEDKYSDELYTAVVEDFKSCTEILFNYLEGWIYTRDTLEMLSKIKENEEAEEQETPPLVDIK